MKVTGENVLIEQTMTKIESLIIRTGKNPDDGIRATFKILAFGNKCPKDELAIGDIPIFTKYVDFQGVKVVSESDDKKVTIIHTIVKYEEIIGADDENPDINQSLN